MLQQSEWDQLDRLLSNNRCGDLMAGSHCETGPKPGEGKSYTNMVHLYKISTEVCCIKSSKILYIWICVCKNRICNLYQCGIEKFHRRSKILGAVVLKFCTMKNLTLRVKLSHLTSILDYFYSKFFRSYIMFSNLLWESEILLCLTETTPSKVQWIWESEIPLLCLTVTTPYQVQWM